jgi:hypothetical protein
MARYATRLTILLSIAASACGDDTTAPPIAPEAPLGFTALATDGGADLFWAFAEGARPRGVRVYWGPPGDLTETSFVPAPETTFEVRGLSNDEAVGFAAEAEDDSGLRSPRTDPQIVTPELADTTPAEILTTVPASGATGAPPDALLSVTFSKPMDATTVTLTIEPERQLYPLQWDASGTELVVAPAIPWQEGETYSVTVAGDDTVGIALAGTRTFGFDVGYLAVAPSVAGFSPDDGLTDVSTDSRITVTYSEPMIVANGRRAIRITPAVNCTWDVSADARQFTCTPQEPLAADQQYTVSVDQAAISARDTQLSAAAEIAFATALGPDSSPPSVLTAEPFDDAIGVDRHFEIAVTFSEPMDITWAQAALIFPSHPGLSGTFTWTNGNRVMRFQPADDPEYGSSIAWTLLGQARDLAGNELGNDLTRSFQIVRTGRMTFSGQSGIDGNVILCDNSDYTDYIDDHNSTMAVGHPNYTYLGPECIARGFYSFNMTGLPEGLTRIQAAVLTFVQAHRDPECAVVGAFWLEHVSIGTGLTVDDFDTPTLLWEDCSTGTCNQVPFAYEGVCFPERSALWTAWVAPAVTQDWDNRVAQQRLSQWRLRAAVEATDVFRSYSFVTASSAHNSARPQLVIDYEIP